MDNHRLNRSNRRYPHWVWDLRNQAEIIDSTIFSFSIFLLTCLIKCLDYQHLQRLTDIKPDNQLGIIGEHATVYRTSLLHRSLYRAQCPPA